MDLDLPMPLEAAEAAVPLRSFREIVTAHQSLVFSIALHTLRNRALAEEVAQEVFLRLSDRLGGIQSEAHLVNWLRTVTSRLCIDELRSHGRKALSLEAVPEPAAEPHPRDPFLSAHLRHLVGELPPPVRVALVLRYQEDLDPSEIARILQEPLPTIKSRLQRGLQALRDSFKTLGVGHGRL
ncbi:RNA polymerase sigma factor [Geothrix limicola]|uniref:RNA polymerase sigma factor n=1 Tax=Geothrix limicola TaxID=2927978 RepID=UPI002555953C|nr:sigma-70 family RNA polymerase sigma factor [Geothrix limicola]